MSPYDPLAMKRIRDHKAAVEKRVTEGRMTAAEGAKLHRALIDEMFRRRGSPVAVTAPKRERATLHIETPDGAFTLHWGTKPT